MAKTKEIEIEGEKFTIRRWTIRERCRIWDKSTDEVDPVTGRVKKMTSEIFTILAISYGSGLTEEQAGNLDAKVGQELLRQILEWNEVAPPLPEISKPEG